MLRSHIKLLGWLLITIVVMGVAFGLDILLGEITDIKNHREDAKKFRSEVAYLLTSTKNLIPELEHEYPLPGRHIADGYGNQSQPRRLFTDEYGLIITGNQNPKNGTGILFLGGSTTSNRS